MTTEFVEVFFKSVCHAQEHNGYVYILCPHCRKGHIVFKKTGAPFIADCHKMRHYTNEREVLAHLEDVHKVVVDKP